MGVGVASLQTSGCTPCAVSTMAAVRANSSEKNRVSCATSNVGFGFWLRTCSRDRRDGQAHVREGEILGDDAAPSRSAELDGRVYRWARSVLGAAVSMSLIGLVL